MCRLQQVSEPEWRERLPLLIGFLSLLAPTIYTLATGLWQETEHAHSFALLALLAWLFWRKWHAYEALPRKPKYAASLCGLLPALAAYVLGRSQDIVMLEVGAFIPVMIALILIDKGWHAVRFYWFPLLFIVFLIPLPSAVVDLLTGTLKNHVSAVAEMILYGAGYPVARTGVVLNVGQYQLLVADACSGLNSMFSLLTVGCLYAYLGGEGGKLRNAILVFAALPIAFVANVIRVMTLILLTYHFGAEAGQGFAHDFAGILLFAVALIVIFALDKFLGLFLKKQVERNEQAFA